MIKACVGVDVGGTAAKLAAVSTAGKVLLNAEISTQPGGGPSSFVERIVAAVVAWTAQDGLRPLGMGLGLAGDVDSRRGALRLAPNLPGWGGYAFKSAFERRLKIPVVVENDANVAVWGAYKTELKSKPRDVVGVTLGTGVGGGLILGGKLHRGATGSAGEIGHTKIEAGGARCHCGGRGCLEAYAGAYGILRAAREILARSPRGGKILRKLCPDLSRLTPEHLARAADGGDAAAREVWEATGRRLAVGLENLVLVLNPEVLLILGGVSRAGHWILDPIQRHFAAQPFRTPFSRVKIALADNPHAGRVGAALLALEDL